MARGTIRDHRGVQSSSEGVTTPSDRRFRDAWVLDPDARVASVDMDEAKKLYRKKLKNAERVQATRMLPQLLDNILDNDQNAKQELKRLRSQSKGSGENIDSAETPEDLLALWDEESLGKWEDA